MRLEGKVAVVTGAGRGIGRSIAMSMAAEGARVVVNDYGVSLRGEKESESPAHEVVDAICGQGGEAVASLETVATMEGGQAIVGTALGSYGRIDILVNNAGIVRDRMVFNMTEEEWDEVIAVHLKGHFTCTRFASARMREQKWGRIINITSRAGLVGNAGQANYAAAKAGIAGFTRTCALDLMKYNITVNAISPSAGTRLTASIPKERVSEGPTHEKWSRYSPDDIAPMAVFLASDAAAHITGQIFHIMGGTITHYTFPHPVNAIHKEGRWSPGEIAEVFDSTLGTTVDVPRSVQ